MTDMPDTRTAAETERLREAIRTEVRALGTWTREKWDEHRGGDPIARTVNAVEDILDRMMTGEVREANAGSRSASPATGTEGLDWKLRDLLRGTDDPASWGVPEDYAAGWIAAINAARAALGTPR